jgi:hypothetical protein
VGCCVQAVMRTHNSSISAKLYRMRTSAVSAASISNTPQGNGGLTCSVLVKRCAKARNHKASLMFGSTWTVVFALRVRLVDLSILQPGLDIRRTVSDGFHVDVELHAAPNRVREASPVLSNTPMLVSSEVAPFLFFTMRVSASHT